MPTAYRLLDAGRQFFTDDGDPYAGGQLFTYSPGSSTKKTTYTASDGATPHANPIVLDSAGRLPNPVWGTTGGYKLVLAPSTDTDPPAAAEWTEDNVSGINDTASSTVDQWVASGLTPTYVSATSFTLVGDQTTEFHVGRRLKTTNSGGTRYCTIISSSYSAPDTTVTVSLDSGSLDSGISSISYGLLSATSPSIPVDWTTASQPFRNRLINGDFSVWQRGTSFTSATSPTNSDDTYLADRWVLLSDGNDIVDVSRETSTIPSGGLYAIALDVETANKKFGILQIIEQQNCFDLAGGTCTLSFKAKVSSVTNLDNVKAAIIAWDGTADTVTSDIVSAWGIEGTSPTLVSNWTYENTPANLGLTTSYQTFRVSADIDTASTKNIAVFIWSDVTTTSLGEFLYITDVQLESGAHATEFERLSFTDRLARCQRYYSKSYNLEVVPGTSTDVGASLGRGLGAGTTTLDSLRASLPVQMRTTPTITWYSTTGASGNIRDASVAANVSVSSNYIPGETSTGAPVVGSGPASANLIVAHWTGSAEL